MRYFKIITRARHGKETVPLNVAIETRIIGVDVRHIACSKRDMTCLRLYTRKTTFATVPFPLLIFDLNVLPFHVCFRVFFIFKAYVGLSGS